MVMASRVSNRARPAQYTHGQKKNRPQQVQDAVNGNSDNPEGQEQQPNDGIYDQR